ncbi:MAG: PP2C family serine/threonine-protein phosphatase [Candidatus Margulisiibacteriota bacterium]|jgi:serine/threonine protein phosphatase PrpC
MISRITTTHPSFAKLQKTERTFLSLITNKRGNVEAAVRLQNAQKLLAAVQKGVICDETAITNALSPLTSHPTLGTLSAQILAELNPAPVLPPTPPIINPPPQASVIINFLPEEPEPPTVKNPGLSQPAPVKPSLPVKPAPAHPGRALAMLKWTGLILSGPIWLLPYLAYKLVAGLYRLATPKMPAHAATTKGALYTPLNIGFGLGGYCSVGGRENNEDAAAIDIDGPKKTRSLYLRLVDGIGGHNGGETAADIVTHKTRQAYLGRSPRKPFDAAEALVLTDQAIKDRAAKNLALEKMGATAATLFIEGKTAQVAWVGDARLYILREGDLILITPDNHLHTAVYRNDKNVPDLYINGKLNSEYSFNGADAAAYHEFTRTDSGSTNVITTALGLLPQTTVTDPDARLAAQKENISHRQIALRPGDTVLLSSDGLHGFIPFDELRGLLRNNTHLPAAARARLLAETALDYMKAAGKEGDNATAIIADLVDDKNGGITFRPTAAKAAVQLILPGEKNPTRIAQDTATYYADDAATLRSVELNELKKFRGDFFPAGTTVYFSPEGKLSGFRLAADQLIAGTNFPAGTRLWVDDQEELTGARLGQNWHLPAGLDVKTGSYLFYEKGKLISAELFGQHILFGLSHPHRTNLSFKDDKVTIRLKLGGNKSKNVGGINYEAKSSLTYDLGKLTVAVFYGSLTLPHFTEPVPDGSRLIFSPNGDLEKIKISAPLRVFDKSDPQVYDEYPAGSTIIFDNGRKEIASIIIGDRMNDAALGSQFWLNENQAISAIKYNQPLTLFGVDFVPGATVQFNNGRPLSITPAADLVLGNFTIGAGLKLDINKDNESFVITVPADATKLADRLNAYTDLPVGSQLEILGNGMVYSITPAAEWEGIVANNTVYYYPNGQRDFMVIRSPQEIGGYRFAPSTDPLFFNGQGGLTPDSIARGVKVKTTQPEPPTPPTRFALAPAYDINDVKSVRTYLRALGALADIEGELTTEEEAIVNQENTRLAEIKQRYGSDQWINMQCLAARTKILELLMS